MNLSSFSFQKAKPLRIIPKIEFETYVSTRPNNTLWRCSKMPHRSVKTTDSFCRYQNVLFGAWNDKYN